MNNIIKLNMISQEKYTVLYGFKKTEACQWNGYFESISICEAKEVSLLKPHKRLTK